MLKRITEPQALYEKEHSADGSAPAKSTMKKRPTGKIIAGVLGAVLFLVVGVAGVMVSQRQQEVAGPVAPNAPASKPLAAIEPDNLGSCELSWTVGGTPTPSPTPTPTPEPVYGTAQCTSKTASLVKADGSLKPLDPNDAVTPGSTIEYQVPVTATQQTKAAVKLEDTLDANTTFLPAAQQPTTEGTVTAAGNKVTIVLPAFTAANQVKNVRYRVKVATKTQPFTFTNTVKVTDNGNGLPSTQNCSIALKTVPTGIASCIKKDAYTLVVGQSQTTLENGSSILKGSEYYYRIRVQATGKTSGPVVLKDTLPAGVTYTDTTQTGVTTEQVNGRTVVTIPMPADFGNAATESDPEIRVVFFKVKLADDINPGILKNVVTVTTGTTNSEPCDHSLEVKPDGVAACVSKEMHNSSLASGRPASESRIKEDDNVGRNTEFYYRIKVNAARQTTGKVTLTDTIPAALDATDPGIFKLENGKYVATYDSFQGEKVAEIKVKVKTGYQSKITNTVAVTTAGSNNSTSTCYSSFNIPTYSCNSSCDNDDQCKQASSNYSCVSTSEGKRCRITSSPNSTSCQTTSTPTPTPIPTPTPTPTVGCNVRCATNADCSNSAHICYQTADGGRCRLDTNVNSATCSTPVAQVTPTPAPGQPTLPQELPQTGPKEWANWLKAGLVTLGIGAVLLLLL